MNNIFEKTDYLSRPPNVYRQTLDVDNLITVCTKKLQEDPTHKKGLFIRSSSLLKKGRFAEAIQDCNQLMQLDPENAGSYYIRGCAFEKLGQIDQSIIDFTTVLSIDPNHINAAYARGACQNKRGNFAEAIEDYNMALEKDTERPTSPGGNSRKIRLRNMNYILD
jgi:tetratricopeptide (TPR) repeat protein